MSSLEFPDVLYPEYLSYSDQPHEVLLDQWPMTTMDLTFDKTFVMQKIAPTNLSSAFQAIAPPFTYSIASDDLSHMNKYTLSTKYKTNSTRLLSKHNHLIYITKKNQLNIQSIPENTYDELQSNTIEHLSSTQQRKHLIQSTTSIRLLDCTVDKDQLLNIALADQKGLTFYSYDISTTISTLTSHIKTPEQTSIHYLSFNPYIPSNAILIDKDYRIYLFDDDTFLPLHQLNNENLSILDRSRQIYIDWDASPFLYTLADNQNGCCFLYDIRLPNETFKELFVLTTNHSYLAKSETIRAYQRSLINPYQHIFITDYSVTIIDSRMPNRSTIHSHHELLRPPMSFTQTKFNNQHYLFINDEYNTNILEYSTDQHRRLIQTSPSWETCPISNSRIYLTNNSNQNDRELLLAKSIYFDVPIRDIAIQSNADKFLYFQLTSAGNIHVQLFNHSNIKNDEKTWNPDPDNLLKNPPIYFQQATDYWSTKFHSHFQCETCLTYNNEPINYTIVTPLKAMLQTSLRDFPKFQNAHQSVEKTIPSELSSCPTCACLPDLSTKGQLSRAKNWIQDWKTRLDEISDSVDSSTLSLPPTNWREIFNYSELVEANKDSSMWNEIHQAWYPPDTKPSTD